MAYHKVFNQNVQKIIKASAGNFAVDVVQEQGTTLMRSYDTTVRFSLVLADMIPSNLTHEAANVQNALSAVHEKFCEAIRSTPEYIEMKTSTKFQYDEICKVLEKANAEILRLKEYETFYKLYKDLKNHGV